MGEVSGLPVGLSFIGSAWSEARILALGAAYEAVSGERPTPTYAPTVQRSNLLNPFKISE
jgi:amidase